MGKLYNRVKMTVSGTPGTGTITLGSAVAGFQSFATAGAQDSDVVSYLIEDGLNWELGQGTYTSSGTTLARTTIVASSNSGSAINASSSAVVMIAALASDFSSGVAINSTAISGGTSTKLLYNNAGTVGDIPVYYSTGSGVVQIGGTTSSFAGFRNSSGTFQTRLADNSGFAPAAFGATTVNGSLTNTGGGFNLNNYFASNSISGNLYVANGCNFGWSSGATVSGASTYDVYITRGASSLDFYTNGSTKQMSITSAGQIQFTNALTVAYGGTGVATLTGIVKGNGTSAFSAAVAGTDYVAPGGALGTPSSGTLTNCTDLPVSTGVSGLGVGVATAAGNAVNGSGGLITYSSYAPASGKTLTVSNSITLAGTDSTTMTFPSSSATIAGLGVAQTFTGTQTFAGSSSVIAAIFNDAAEVATVSATAATGTINYDVSTQSVLYYTSNASANWTVNFRHSSGTSLNTAMSTGQAITVAFLVTQGASAFFNNAVQVDGSSVTPLWQGGTAPTTGNTSSVDVYTYTIVKTGNAAFTVFASQTQFK